MQIVQRAAARDIVFDIIVSSKKRAPRQIGLTRTGPIVRGIAGRDFVPNKLFKIAH